MALPSAGSQAPHTADAGPMPDGEYARMRQYEDDYWWYRGLRSLTARAITRHSRVPAPDILDAGCGTGGEMDWLSRSHPSAALTGVDLSAVALPIARTRGLQSLARASTSSLPFAARTFDVVCSLDVLYIRGVDERAALLDIWRVLRPGGILVLNLPAFEALRGAHDVAVATRRRYRRGEVAALLRDAGFQLATLTYWNLLAFLPIALARRWSRAVPEGKASSDFRTLPPFANKALSTWLGFEGALACRFGLALGTSVFAVGRRPGPGPAPDR